LASSAAEPKRVAMLPFKINSEKDLSFLKDGIFDMLTSRLSSPGKVEVLDRKEVETAIEKTAGSQKIDENLARNIGQQLKADFVLFGSLTVFGNSVSIDAKMVDVNAQRPSMVFSDQSQDLGAVITKINLIAADINANLFGRVSQAKQAPSQTQSAPIAQERTSENQAAKDDIHAHPEKLLEGGQMDEALGLESEAGEVRKLYRNFWKSANFRLLINGVAVADVDGDKKLETVVITPHAVLIYRSEQKKFFKTHELAQSKQVYLIGVDAADINGNGYAEIFVTSLNSLRNKVDSFVLEYDGENYQKIVQDSSWFYRVASSSIRDEILLGQKHRSTKPFSGAIFEMNWENADYAPLNEIKTPGDISLMGLSLGDVLNSQQEVAVAYKQDDRLQIFELSGENLWTSSARYGGSMLYYLKPKTDENQIENRLYFPSRTMTRRETADVIEVITVKNHDLTGHKLALRKFTDAHIESFTWDGLGLTPNWKTRRISGRISDFAIGDFNNDGKIELVAAVIIAEGTMVFTESKSAIIAYELKP
jgi:TolB-like protein